MHKVKANAIEFEIFNSGPSINEKNTKYLASRIINSSFMI